LREPRKLGEESLKLPSKVNAYNRALVGRSEYSFGDLALLFIGQRRDASSMPVRCEREDAKSVGASGQQGAYPRAARKELFEARNGLFGSCSTDPLIEAVYDEHEPVVFQGDPDKVPELLLILTS
jgi:hypothetical protein